MEEDEKAEWRKTLRLDGDKPLFFTTVDYDAHVAVWPGEADPRYNYSKTVILFSGIADDTPLRAYLSDTYKIVDVLKFPDHHKFSGADIRSIAAAVRRYPTAALLTTEKDAVRVLDCKKVDDSIRKRLFAVPVKASFIGEGEAQAFARILSRL